jgi:DNA-binding CsgD family transcriptional regulator
MRELRFFAQRVLGGQAEPAGAEVWSSLLGGGWRILDHFDDQGRRYVIACRAGRSAALVPDEQVLVRRRARGDALKEIAADLGISISAVSRRLSGAMRKLGVRSHAELPRLFAG